MHPLRRFSQALLNVLGTSYALALLGLLVLHLLGRDHRWWIAFLINFMPFYFVPLLALAVLALLVRARPALIATTPLALVGLILYGPLFFPKPAPIVSGSPLTVITFNVSDKNQQRDMVLAWLREQHADIVFLQEVSVDWFAPIRQALSDLYPEQVPQLTEAGYRGNLTLSRFPLIAAPAPTSSAFQPTIFNVDSQRMAFYNVSLVTPVDAPPHREFPFEYPFLDLAMRYDDQFRNRQIEQLLAQVQTSDSALRGRRGLQYE